MQLFEEDWLSPSRQVLRKLILVCGSDNDLLGLLALVLRRAGYLSIALTSDEPVAERSGPAIDVIVLDASPAEDATHTVAALRQQVGSTIPLIVLVDSSQLDELSQPGITVPIVKPFSTSALIAVLRELLGDPRLSG